MVRRQLLQVTDRVLCVRLPGYLSCSYVVLYDDHVVCVDSGMDPDGGDMGWAMRQLDRPLEQIRSILVTHWHNDHCGGAARLRARTGATVYHHPAARPKLQRQDRARGPRRWLARLTPEVGMLGPIRALLDAAPPIALDEGREVREGDRLHHDFLVMETPGHDDAHLSFWFEPDRVLFTGDALAVAGDHVSYMSRWLTADVESARRSMLRCLGMDARALCPGHRHPLVDPDPAMLEAVAERTRHLARWPIYGC